MEPRISASTEAPTDAWMEFQKRLTNSARGVESVKIVSGDRPMPRMPSQLGVYSSHGMMWPSCTSFATLKVVEKVQKIGNSAITVQVMRAA